MSHTVAVVTWNNARQLIDTLLSLVRNTDFAGRLVVVNNGSDTYETIQGAVPYDLDWIDAGRNLGWEGGVNLALERCETDFFTMLNDDVLFPPASINFWDNTLRWFHLTDTGGVGPSSNYVSGYQNAFLHIGHPVIAVPYLIGFCATYRTKLLKDLGGLDATLPGGDDLDLSMRVRKAGFNLVADRRNFLFHHGGQTGQRVHPGTWDSQGHQADTYNALIKKHGLKAWYDCVNGAYSDRHSLWLAQNVILKTRQGMESCQSSVGGLYAKARIEPSDINGHLDTLRAYASLCNSVVEFGTNDGTSTAAFLSAAPWTLDTYDIVRKPEVEELERITAGGPTRFKFHQQSTLEATIGLVDMLFIDDLHTYEHVKAELERHASRVMKYLAFHDVSLFRESDEVETKSKNKGVWRAVTEFMRSHTEWTLVYHTENLNGLAVFARAS